MKLQEEIEDNLVLKCRFNIDSLKFFGGLEDIWKVIGWIMGVVEAVEEIQEC